MRLRALALVSVASLALLGACGDDGGDDSPEAQTFCSVVAPIQELPTVLEQEDVASVEATMTAAETALAQVSGAPPEGIAADVEVVRTTFDAANNALEPVGYDYAQVADADFEALNALTEPGFQTAADNIQAWSEDNC
jgi:hypothetical protein